MVTCGTDICWSTRSRLIRDGVAPALRGKASAQGSLPAPAMHARSPESGITTNGTSSSASAAPTASRATRPSPANWTCRPATSLPRHHPMRPPGPPELPHPHPPRPGCGPHGQADRHRPHPVRLDGQHPHPVPTQPRAHRAGVPHRAAPERRPLTAARLNRDGRGTRVEIHPFNQSGVSRLRQRPMEFAGSAPLGPECRRVGGRPRPGAGRRLGQPGRRPRFPVRPIRVRHQHRVRRLTLALQDFDRPATPQRRCGGRSRHSRPPMPLRERVSWFARSAQTGRTWEGKLVNTFGAWHFRRVSG